jgi:hypothetical protein
MQRSHPFKAYAREFPQALAKAFETWGFRARPFGLGDVPANWALVRPAPFRPPLLAFKKIALKDGSKLLSMRLKIELNQNLMANNPPV